VDEVVVLFGTCKLIKLDRDIVASEAVDVLNRGWIDLGDRFSLHGSHGVFDVLDFESAKDFRQRQRSLGVDDVDSVVGMDFEGLIHCSELIGSGSTSVDDTMVIAQGVSAVPDMDAVNWVFDDFAIDHTGENVEIVQLGIGLGHG
jgi:hypothetical protein